MSATRAHPAHPTRRPARATSTHTHNLAASRARHRERARRRRWVGWAIAALLAAAAVAGVAFGGRSTPVAISAGAAPAFRLASTSGEQVALGDFRGKNVLLYFNEGVGCDACFYQTVEIETDGTLARDGVTLLPIVMNSASQVAGELRRFDVRTPYLVDPDGTTSRAYKTLGTGHHANLPGHSFVLIGPDGRIRWRGDYPGMWVEPKQLAATVARNLG